MKRLIQVLALVFILPVSTLALANVANQLANAAVPGSVSTPVFTALGEPPPRESDDTAAPPRQIGQCEFVLPQSVAVIGLKVTTFRWAGSHRNTHSFHQCETPQKIEEEVSYYLVIPNTVFKLISRQCCQYLDMPPPHA